MNEVDTSMRSVLLKAAAEMIGTFGLVFFGCGAIIAQAQFPERLQPSNVPLVFGVVIATMIYATGHLSGAHFNPAVTVGFAVSNKFPWREVPTYVLAQIGGATIGAAVLYVLFPGISNFGATVPHVPLHIAFIWEFVLTFFLMFVIYSVATDARAVGTMAGMAIGGTVALGAFVGGPFTGASMNPARTIGPALIQGEYTSLWIYLTAPFAGAMLAAFVYEKIKCISKEPDAEVKGCC